MIRKKYLCMCYFLTSLLHSTQVEGLVTRFGQHYHVCQAGVGGVTGSHDIIASDYAKALSTLSDEAKRLKDSGLVRVDFL